MATVFKLKSDRSEEQNPQAPQQEQKLSSFQTPTSNQPSTTNVPQEQRQAGSGRFQNLEKMLDANKQQQFGQQFGARVEDQAKGMQSKAESNVKEQQDQWSGLRGQIENQSKLINQVKEDPTKVDVDQWKYYQGGGYQSDVNAFQPDTTQANIQAGNIQQLAGDVSTTEGRSGVLSNIYAKPGSNYTSGMNRFDNLFLQKTPGQLASVQEPVKQIGQQTQSNIQNVLANIGSEKESTLGQIESLIPQGQEAVETGISGVNKQAEDYLAGLNRDYYSLQENLNAGNIPKWLADSLGITLQPTRGETKLISPTQTQNVSGLNLLNYLQNPTEGSVSTDYLTQEQVDRLNALDLLSGGMGNSYNVGKKAGTTIESISGTENIDKLKLDNQEINNNISKINQSFDTIKENPKYFKNLSKKFYDVRKSMGIKPNEMSLPYEIRSAYDYDATRGWVQTDRPDAIKMNFINTKEWLNSLPKEFTSEFSEQELNDLFYYLPVISDTLIRGQPRNYTRSIKGYNLI